MGQGKWLRGGRTLLLPKVPHSFSHHPNTQSESWVRRSKDRNLLRTVVRLFWSIFCGLFLRTCWTFSLLCFLPCHIVQDTIIYHWGEWPRHWYSASPPDPFLSCFPLDFQNNVTLLLEALQWLPIILRIKFKLFTCVIQSLLTSLLSFAVAYPMLASWAFLLVF